MFALARGQIAARNRHWKALKRHAGGILRLSFAGSSAPGQEPVLSRTGPLTFTDRREMVLRAMKALETLTEKDRELVMGQARGEDLTEQAERLGLTYQAAQRARLRALERFQVAFRVLGTAGN